MSVGRATSMAAAFGETAAALPRGWLLFFGRTASEGMCCTSGLLREPLSFPLRAVDVFGFASAAASPAAVVFFIASRVDLLAGPAASKSSMRELLQTSRLAD